MTRILAIVLPLLAVALFLGACGGTEKSVAPQPENPFAAARVGTDSTLEVVTWNLENFAKNGATTVDLVVDAVAALQADIIALQEIESGFRFTVPLHEISHGEYHVGTHVLDGFDSSGEFRIVGMSGPVSKDRYSHRPGAQNRKQNNRVHD